jgi:asparagine synthase (glutamine-hydrolysing)
MCGIAGLLSFQEEALSALEGMRTTSRLMRRRGPDDDGLWTDRSSCVMAVRRLSILDTSSAAHQPMVSADGRYALAFNGECYNFGELRRELEGHGTRFRSSGDTEVALYALARWGPDALRRFNGMFALAFYDTRDRSLVLARDHAGIKPLYYLLGPEGLLFASQFDQILSHDWAQTRGLRREGLALYLHLGHVPAPYTLLEDTHMLEPGTWIRVRSNASVQAGRHFTFPVHRRADLRGEEAVEAVGEAISRAVRRQMVSDVPVGALLSGGIDSPLVAAEMREASGDEIPAFTLASEDPAFDESPDARAYARRLGLVHHVRRVGHREACDALARVLESCADPLEDYSLFPTFLVCESASPHVKVLLSGDGGDDVFWGYVARQCSVLEPLLKNGSADGRQGMRTSVRRLSQGVRRWARGRLTPRDSGPASGEAYLRRQRFVALPWLEDVFATLPPWPSDCALFDCESSDPDEVAQWIRWNEFSGHLPRVLLKVDRASMYHSLEVRVPLLDKEVLDVATRTDWRSCLDVEKRVGKLPLRQLLELRAGHASPGKQGFSVPMGDWLRNELRPLLEDNLLARDELLGLPLRRAALRDSYDRHLRRTEDIPYALWRLLSLSLWEERYFARRGARVAYR